MDFRHPYLTEQLIAYLGSKRALLPFLHGVFSRLVEEPTRATFIDPFAGTGAVSRLARLMGFAVCANDWEPYTFVINSCHIGLQKKDLRGLFGSRGGLEQVLAVLNSLRPPSAEQTYIARHYAPRSTESADWRTERLFYTTENALVMDTVRNRIEEMYPGAPREEAGVREKMTLLAPLLYEAATHTNTSGVFKACHRGFGGHGRDALKRIMAGIRMREPVLIDCPRRAEVACMDAGAFLRGRGADICYLDPPYATHQYGSNYFMLNTIALWDKPPVSEERGPDGRLRQKAGIREDWTRTRSAFCYRDTAPRALREVAMAADCRYLVVSYSDEGLIGLEELCDILAGTGSLSVESTGYVKYPGGKQSLSRTTRNQELALVVDRRARRSAGRAVSAGAPAIVLQVRLARLLAGSFHPVRVRAALPVEGDAIVAGPGAAGRLPMRRFWRFQPGLSVPRFSAHEDAERFAALLSGCVVRDVNEEISVLLQIAQAEQDAAEREKLLKEILRLLNKMAHRKYRQPFLETLESLRAYTLSGEAGARFRAGLDRISAVADRRLAAAART